MAPCFVAFELANTSARFQKIAAAYRIWWIWTGWWHANSKSDVRLVRPTNEKIYNDCETRWNSELDLLDRLAFDVITITPPKA